MPRDLDDYKVIIQAINYLAKKAGGSIDKIKLIKLLYLADKYHLRKYGRTITEDSYYAMEYGPVASTVLDILNNTLITNDPRSLAKINKYITQYLEIQKNTIRSKEKVDFAYLSKSDIEALNFVYEKVGNMPSFDLSKYTHKTPEYKKHEEVLIRGKKKRAPMNFEEWFKESDDVAAKATENVAKLTKEIFSDIG